MREREDISAGIGISEEEKTNSIAEVMELWQRLPVEQRISAARDLRDLARSQEETIHQKCVQIYKETVGN